MIVQRITRVFVDPVMEFENYVKLLQDNKWQSVLNNSHLRVFEKSERVFNFTIDDLTKKEQ